MEKVGLGTWIPRGPLKLHLVGNSEQALPAGFFSSYPGADTEPEQGWVPQVRDYRHG